MRGSADIYSDRWTSAPARHGRFLDHAVDELMNDEGVIGVCAGGSLMAGTADVYSDLDLVVVSASHARERLMTERREVAARLGKLLGAFTGEHVGEPRLLICLYGPRLLHVDLKFIETAELADRVEDPLVLADRDGVTEAAIAANASRFPETDFDWVAERAWIWIHYGIEKALRGELFECLDMLAFFRGQVLGPMIAAASGHKALPGQGVRRLEVRAPGWSERLVGTVAAPEADSCLRALEVASGLYAELRNELAPAEPRADELAVRQYLDDVLV